jgi:outer membrane protein assembly factor BamE (lipoprotein component of BamABCDE complex)
MTKFLGKIMAVLAVVAIAFACGGCKTTKTTEVNDKLFGGTEVKEKTVTEVGDKATVTEKKTEYDAKGNKTETKTKTTGN